MPALGLTTYSGRRTINTRGHAGGIIFMWAGRNNLKEKAASEQKLGEEFRNEPCGYPGKALQTERNTRAKVWKQEHVWHIQKGQGDPNVAGAG